MSARGTPGIMPIPWSAANPPTSPGPSDACHLLGRAKTTQDRAFCGIRLVKALDAVHIIPVEYNGPDDPRDAPVLCATHHRAFDSAAFSVDPSALKLVPRSPLTEKDLKITRPDLRHLPLPPHPDALAWRWERWLRLNKPPNTHAPKPHNGP